MSTALAKRPADILDYTVDFFRWLPDGDRIVAVTSDIEGGTAAIDSTEHSDTAVKVWISGGDAGDTARITTTITTDQGRVRQECFRLRIEACPS